VRGALLAAGLFLATAGAAAQGLPPLPLPVQSALPALKPLGEGRLRFFGLHVYDSALWALDGVWSFERAFALDIRYAMSIKGRDLSRRSIEEMRNIGVTDDAKLRRWEAAMDRLFPDIRPGDRLVGLHLPGREARFYNQERLIGTVPDPEFARAFFGIWLDERTSEPKLRAQMLKLAD